MSDPLNTPPVKFEPPPGARCFVGADIGDHGMARPSELPPRLYESERGEFIAILSTGALWLRSPSGVWARSAIGMVEFVDRFTRVTDSAKVQAFSEAAEAAYQKYNSRAGCRNDGRTV